MNPNQFFGEIRSIKTKAEFSAFVTEDQIHGLIRIHLDPDAFHEKDQAIINEIKNKNTTIHDMIAHWRDGQITGIGVSYRDHKNNIQSIFPK